MTADSSGHVFTIDAYSQNDGTSGSTVVQWDGSGWVPVVAQANTQLKEIIDVFALAADHRGNIYAGGYPAIRGSSSASLKRWTGNAWTKVSDEPNGVVYALTAGQPGNIYAGGYFTAAGNLSLNHIARW